MSTGQRGSGLKRPWTWIARQVAGASHQVLGAVVPQQIQRHQKSGAFQPGFTVCLPVRTIQRILQASAPFPLTYVPHSFQPSGISEPRAVASPTENPPGPPSPPRPCSASHNENAEQFCSHPSARRRGTLRPPSAHGREKRVQRGQRRRCGRPQVRRGPAWRHSP